jgi:hypothetical protein
MWTAAVRGLYLHIELCDANIGIYVVPYAIIQQSPDMWPTDVLCLWFSSGILKKTLPSEQGWLSD